MPGVSQEHATSGAVQAGSEIDYSPFCLVNADGSAAGFSVELLRAALKTVGRDVDFRTGTWAAIKQDLADGRLQVLPLVGRTPEREAIFDFTFPYTTMHGTIVVRTDTKDIRGPGDLKGRRVAVLRADNAEEYLARSGLGAIIVPRDSFDVALRELSSGQHDAVVIQKLLAYQLIDKARLTNLITVGPPLYEQNFCFAVRKGEARLLSDLNEGLSIVMADGTFKRLRETWFSAIEAAGRRASRVVVRGSSDNPPYEFLDAKGQPAGLYVDITRAVSQKVGLDVEIQLSPGVARVDSLKNSGVDAIQGVRYSPALDEFASFSVPVNIERFVIVTRKEQAGFKEIGDLAGKSIVVVSGGVMEDFASSLGYGSHLRPVGSTEEALRLLASGKFDCALLCFVPATYWIRQRHWNNLVVGDKPVLEKEVSFAVQHGNEELLTMLDDGLASLKESAQWRQIQRTWLGPYEGAPLRDVAVLLFWILGPAFVVVAALLLWSRTLQKRVAQRTKELSLEVDNGLALQKGLQDSLALAESARAERENAYAELKRSQERYAALNDELEERVRRRTAELEASIKELEAFSYSVSHDLRAPLRAIDGYANLLIEEYGGQFDEEARRLLDIVLGSVHSMQHLIDDLLAYTRAGKSQARNELVDMDSLVHDAWEELTALPPYNRAALDLEPLHAARGDPIMLKQVWINLIGNALKYSSKKDDPRIEIRSSDDGGSTIYSIHDNGAGFDMRYANKLFVPFQRLHSQIEFEGSGVGLAIVQRLVLRQGGSVWGEGEPGKGATFSFSLPGNRGGTDGR